MSAATSMTAPEMPRTVFRAVVRAGASAEKSTAFVLPPSLEVGALEALARSRPAELVRLAHAGELDAVDLSEVAEAMRHAPPSAVISTLLGLTRHARPVVRESALVGLSPFLSISLEARDRLRDMAEADPSEGVKSVAQELLNSL